MAAPVCGMVPHEYGNMSGRRSNAILIVYHTLSHNLSGEFKKWLQIYAAIFVHLDV